jgi:hypothetical protein
MVVIEHTYGMRADTVALTHTHTHTPLSCHAMSHPSNEVKELKRW